MEKIEIKEVKTIEDARICDDFRTKLANNEARFDEYAYCKKYEKFYEQILHRWDCFPALALCNGKPVGFVYAEYSQAPKHSTSKLHVLRIKGIYVDEEYRKMGIGKVLIQAVDDWAKKLCERQDYLIKVEANINNIDAINVYKHLGFEEYTLSLRRDKKKAE